MLAERNLSERDDYRGVNDRNIFIDLDRPETYDWSSCVRDDYFFTVLCRQRHPMGPTRPTHTILKYFLVGETITTGYGPKTDVNGLFEKVKRQPYAHE